MNEGLSTKDAKKLNKASILTTSDDPKKQDRARARQVDVDYKDLVDTNEKYIKGRNIFQPLDKEVKKACEES